MISVHDLECIKLFRDQNRSRITFSILRVKVHVYCSRSCWLSIGFHPDVRNTSIQNICIWLSARFHPTFGTIQQFLFFQDHVDIFLVQKQTSLLQFLDDLLFPINLFLLHHSFGGTINFIEFLRRLWTRKGVFADERLLALVTIEVRALPVTTRSQRFC